MTKFYIIPVIQILLGFSHSFDRKLVVDFIANGKETPPWVRINSRFEIQVFLTIKKSTE